MKKFILLLFCSLLIASVAAAQHVTVELIPNSDPIIVPAGGSFDYVGVLTNHTPEPVTVDLWVMLHVPHYGEYGPIMLVEATLPPHAVIERHVTQLIPIWAPRGDYGYAAYVGHYPDAPVSHAMLHFTVVDPIEGGGENWVTRGWEEESVPAEFAVGGNYPNPFNATTTILFQLPTQSEITLEVFNMLGQKVTTLAEGTYNAGDHTVAWDAGNHASGMYFYRLSTPDNVITKRMTLLK